MLQYVSAEGTNGRNKASESVVTIKDLKLSEWEGSTVKLAATLKAGSSPAVKKGIR